MLTAVPQRCFRSATSLARIIVQRQPQRSFADDAPSTSGKMSFTFASPTMVSILVKYLNNELDFNCQKYICF